MTRDECKILVKGMKAVYADPKFIPDRDAFDVWFALLADLSYDGAQVAIQRYMMTSHFPPTVADIRDQYTKVTKPPQMSGMEAWALARRALSDSTYHSEDRYAELPPIVQRAIGSAENLRTMAMDDNPNEDVQRSNFLKTYEILCARDREDTQLPEKLRQLIDKTAQISKAAV